MRFFTYFKECCENWSSTRIAGGIQNYRQRQKVEESAQHTRSKHGGNENSGCMAMYSSYHRFSFLRASDNQISDCYVGYRREPPDLKPHFPAGRLCHMHYIFIYSVLSLPMRRRGRRVASWWLLSSRKPVL